MVSLEEMEKYYNEKHRDALKVSFRDISFEVRRGFFDTTRGLLLTSVVALKANEVNREGKYFLKGITNP